MTVNTIEKQVSLAKDPYNEMMKKYEEVKSLMKLTQQKQADSKVAETSSTTYGGDNTAGFSNIHRSGFANLEENWLARQGVFFLKKPLGKWVVSINSLNRY